MIVFEEWLSFRECKLTVPWVVGSGRDREKKSRATQCPSFFRQVPGYHSLFCLHLINISSIASGFKRSDVEMSGEEESVSDQPPAHGRGFFFFTVAAAGEHQEEGQDFLGSQVPLAECCICKEHDMRMTFSSRRLQEGVTSHQLSFIIPIIPQTASSPEEMAPSLGKNLPDLPQALPQNLSQEMCPGMFSWVSWNNHHLPGDLSCLKVQSLSTPQVGVGLHLARPREFLCLLTQLLHKCFLVSTIRYRQVGMLWGKNILGLISPESFILCVISCFSTMRSNLGKFFNDIILE